MDKSTWSRHITATQGGYNFPYFPKSRHQDMTSDGRIMSWHRMWTTCSEVAMEGTKGEGKDWAPAFAESTVYRWKRTGSSCNGSGARHISQDRIGHTDRIYYVGAMLSTNATDLRILFSQFGIGKTINIDYDWCSLSPHYCLFWRIFFASLEWEATSHYFYYNFMLAMRKIEHTHLSIFRLIIVCKFLCWDELV